MEHLSQFNMTILYIRGEDNTIADALLCTPFPNKNPNSDSNDELETCTITGSFNALLSISTDDKFLHNIREGYKVDDFCKKLCSTAESTPGVCFSNKLWYIGDRLVIPCFGSLHEDLFQLAHDTLGHFGADKSYAALHDSYYWPNMWRDLESTYIPACAECQCNKGPTSKAKGLLHPLAIPDNCGDSVCLNFMGPLPEDKGHNCILTIMD